MGTFIDLTGRKFGRLTAMEFLGGPYSQWRCQCDCGRQSQPKGSYLRDGRAKSCGCFSRNLLVARSITHGLTQSPAYNCWANMKRRCTNPADSKFNIYGGRGITVCARWMFSLENFVSDMGPRPVGTTLDRIDPDGSYSPDNCRWATKSVQNQNRRKVRCIQNFTTEELLAELRRRSVVQ